MYLPIAISTYSAGWAPYKTDPEAYARLRERIPTLPPEHSEWSVRFWGTTEDIEVLAELDIDWNLDKHELRTQTGSIIMKLAKQHGESYQTTERAVAQGEAVQLSIPDLGLLAIDQTLLLEDCCTDVLQEHLNKGWRILAVCPAPQRRPDYILGRRGGREKEESDGA